MQTVTFSSYPLTGRPFNGGSNTEISVNVSKDLNIQVMTSKIIPSLNPAARECGNCSNSLLTERPVYIFQCQHIYCLECARQTIEKGEAPEQKNLKKTCIACNKIETNEITESSSVLDGSDKKTIILENNVFKSLDQLEEDLPVQCPDRKKMMRFQEKVTAYLAHDTGKIHTLKSNAINEPGGITSQLRNISLSEQKGADASSTTAAPATSTVKPSVVGVKNKNPVVSPRVLVMYCLSDHKKLVNSKLFQALNDDHEKNYKLYPINQESLPTDTEPETFKAIASNHPSKKIFMFITHEFLKQYARREGNVYYQLNTALEKSIENQTKGICPFYQDNDVVAQVKGTIPGLSDIVGTCERSPAAKWAVKKSCKCSKLLD